MTDTRSYPDTTELAERFQFFGEKAYRPEIFGADDRAPGPRVTQAECLAIAAALRGVAQAAPDDVVGAAKALVEEISTRGTHERWKRLDKALYALSSTDRATLPGHDETMANLDALTISPKPQCTCAAIVNPNIPHARSCPLSSEGK